MAPDVDKACAFFMKKARTMTNKLMSVSEAVNRFIPDGTYIVTGVSA